MFINFLCVNRVYLVLLWGFKETIVLELFDIGCLVVFFENIIKVMK